MLKDAHGKASNGEKVTGIHLFGIKYAKELQELRSRGTSVADIVKAAEFTKTKSTAYVTEVNKGMNLAPYVSLKNKDLWF